MKKVVLITGASSGIGKATAIQLAKSGHIVYAMARRLEKMQELEMLNINIFQGDVTDDEICSYIVNTIIDKEGRIDVLINNAGYGTFDILDNTSIELGKNMFEVNVFALVNLIQKTLPYMKEHNQGHIINISSIVAELAIPRGAWYCASKYAVEGISDALRLELSSFNNIFVTSIQPGGVDTEFMDAMTETSLDNLNNVQKLLRKHPFLLSSPIKIAEEIEKLVVKKRPPFYSRPTWDAKLLYILKKLLGRNILYTIMKKTL